MQEIQKEVKFPAASSQSRLPLSCPDDTLVFVALLNLGDAAHQVLTVFQRERQKNPALRAWCVQKNVAGFGPKMEDSLETFYQFSQY